MTETIQVPDMMCEACASKIRTALQGVEGVSGIDIEVPAKTVTVQGTAPRKQLLKAIEKVGYSPK